MFPARRLRFGCQHCQYTSLTVTRMTDADTVVDYPTFVWLHRMIDHISHFSAASLQSDLSFGPRMLCGENRLFRGASVSLRCSGLLQHLILCILCVGNFPQYSGNIHLY